jgi:hypothetical protein
MDRRSFLYWAVMPLLGAQEWQARSAPDPGTEIDDTKAAKARRLAEHVIREKGRPLVYATQDGSSSSVTAGMVIRRAGYTVKVARGERDKMTIVLRERDSAGAIISSALTDTGIDGLCDAGTIQGPGLEIAYDANASPQIGIEHRQRFQELYNKTLDTLIAFYERRGL